MKRVAIVLLSCLLLAIAIPGTIPVGYEQLAYAQQSNQQPQIRRLNLLDLLFGGALRKQRQRTEAPPPKTRRVIVAPGSRGGAGLAGVQPSQKPVVVKSETAAKLLVAGDFMSGSLFWGLEQAYASNPNAIVIDKSNGLSGIVRNDVVDWPQAIGDHIDQLKPAIVVFQIGMNDRQQMRMAGERVAKFTEVWKAEYDRRVDGIVRAVRDRNVPLIWVGLPPVKAPAMNTDYLAFNEIFRTRVEAAGGKFIDVWDGFTNAEGQFVNAGPDINGQIVRLRNSDGINMTRAGMSKLAFYVEREIRRMIGLGAETQVASLAGPDSPSAALDPQYDPASTGRTIIIALDGAQADGGDFLEGGSVEEEEKSAGASMAHTLVAHGIAYLPQPGRVDAGWGRSAVEVAKPDPVPVALILPPPLIAPADEAQTSAVPVTPGDGAPSAITQTPEQPLSGSVPVQPAQQRRPEQKRREAVGLPGVWINPERN